MRVAAAPVDLDGRLDRRNGLVPVACRKRDERRLEDGMLEPEQVTLATEQRLKLVEHTGQPAGVAEVSMSGLEPVQARGQRLIVAGRPARSHGTLPVIERTIESQRVGRDDGQAREQIRVGTGINIYVSARDIIKTNGMGYMEPKDYEVMTDLVMKYLAKEGDQRPDIAKMMTNQFVGDLKPSPAEWEQMQKNGQEFRPYLS